ncbi:HET-domain-containing protein, partial [Pyrenochaeta sp. DS3sAY3a]
QRFEYKPLSRRKHQIRVLRVKNLGSGGSSSGDVHCTIETVTLKSKPSYRALSYTWGPPEPKFTIYVNDAPFQVSQNLYEFLKAFRGRPEAAEPIWIDQIAINQNDIPERNSQVSKMKNVYVSAKEVIMWLGPGTAQEIRAEAKELAPESLELLQAFANNPYFHRLWVVQEVILAAEIQVLIGDQVLVWDDLYKVFSKHSKKFADESTDMSEPIRAIERLGISRIDHRGIEPSITNIEDHIDCFKAQKCVDPRDKIYGIVGM